MDSFTFFTRTTSDLLQLANTKLGLLGWNYSKNKAKEVSLRKKLATTNFIKKLEKIVEDEHLLEEINQQSRKRPSTSDDTQPIKLAKTDFDGIIDENENEYVPQEDVNHVDWNQSAEEMYKKDMEDFKNEKLLYEPSALMDDDPIFDNLGFLFEDN